MDGKIYYFWLVTIIQWKWAHSIPTSISGEILENVTFIHKTFPVPPSDGAIIQYDVHFQMMRPFPTLGIYTTPDHVNIQRKCTYRSYGQVRNTAMHQDFGYWYSQYGHNSCEWVENNTRHCTGNITVQDFIRRKFYFSLGFNCRDVTPTTSLKGLIFNITIYPQREGVTCFPITEDSICRNYYRYGGFPSLLGDEHIRDSSLSWLLRNSFQCYQYPIELFCHIYVPQCLSPYSTESLHPCREMCHDYFYGCGNVTINMNCDYLPSMNDGIECYDKRVMCSHAHPTILNGTVVIYTTTKRTYRVEFSCKRGFTLEGNSTIACLHSGEWSSELPVCLPIATPRSESWVLVLTTIFILYIVAMVVIIVAVIYKMRLKAMANIGFEREQVEADIELKEIDEPLVLYRREKNHVNSDSPVKRNREFDAFVLYHFDSDDVFVVETLLSQLEENRDFKLCIHSRDFTPGRDIKDNIEEAIEGSNSAIIIMSQGFVDSMWCKEEFTHCYIENMKDAAFNLFVIMMQPAETLVNISPYMKTFIANKTYLQIKDPELFSKLATHLEDARQPGNDDIDDDNDENLGNEEDQIEDFKLYWHLDEIAAQEIKV